MSALIENTVEISRTREEVFDYLADQENKIHWNPDCLSMEKLTDGPVAAMRSSMPRCPITSRMNSSPSGHWLRPNVSCWQGCFRKPVLWPPFQDLDPAAADREPGRADTVQPTTTPA
jgi:hypothetical protein